LLRAAGIQKLAVSDSHGALTAERDNLDDAKRSLVDDLGLDGDIERPDVLIGLATPGAFELNDIEDATIVFALANPDPEVDPDQARQRGAAVVTTGRSDFRNQINNVLVFPGLLRGLLDGGKRFDDDAALRAAHALAALVDDPSPERILPEVLDDCVAPAIAAAVS